jgi:hypothetical protein
MSTFNYFEDVRIAYSDMISEIGTSCTIEVPTHTIDTWGNHISTTYATTTEVIWVRALSEDMIVANVGQLNHEDIRFVAKYNTVIVIEARITYNGIKYYVLGIDKPDLTGNVVNKVGFAKKELT